MKHGVVLPGGSAAEQLEQAVLAEQSGWDGVFSFETNYGVDPWTLLAAVAARTQRVSLGTIITPLPWRRPWKLASQVATLDQLSGGRAILGVGVGAVDDGLPSTGEVTGLRERAGMMDEGIDLMRALWAGESDFRGAHYEYRAPAGFGDTAKPVGGSVPIWVIGVWPRPKSMRRVLRCEGVIPQFGSDEPSPATVAEIRDWLAEHDKQADIVVDGESPATDPQPYADAGATWWLETRWAMPGNLADRMRELTARIAAGPHGDQRQPAASKANNSAQRPPDPRGRPMTDGESPPPHADAGELTERIAATPRDDQRQPAASKANNSAQRPPDPRGRPVADGESAGPRRDQR